ncbi:MAG: phosphatase PAP2 family protein [Phenylobacterium sp.]|uniref:acid phosphatase n=1 Tax=Phenylobacterium sp. TaxID=1871053 RepID=UPI00271803E7|nr:phosphatase PAP2 family protein [Phenylobacterium sp.]MDO9432599.1 phosphatase PAP2 family protein [Phenylobacterium sp.]
MTKRGWLTTLAACALLAGCASTSGAGPQTGAQAKAAPSPLKEIMPGYLPGYLAPGTAPNSLSLLPPPPAAGSAAQARDDEAAKAAVALSGTPRWTLATHDAELKFPKAAQTFACAMDVKISEADTPNLYRLLRRTLADNGLSTYPTKNKFKRARPFTVNGAPICTPNEEQVLRNDGSYPSGHSAIGWGWALVLTQVAPDRANEVLARGRAFANSRVICNVHWLSDTEEGRTMASAVVAKLQSDATFQTDLAAAKAEVAAARAKGLKPDGDCAAEAAQLAAG